MLSSGWKYIFYGILHVNTILNVCSTNESTFNLLESEIVIESSSGFVSGPCFDVLNSSVITFFGIPYAKPPLEDKRFAKPEPVEKWHGVWRADKKSPACMQYSTRKFPWSYLGTEKSEDCLYLNIWIPSQHDCEIPRGLPVMVYIHGGGFCTGSSRMEELDASVLSTLGKIIVVNLNYRLGMLGFFNAGISDAPGNVGMLDQLLAMKWVKENIHQFGGDPNTITLAGQSAGSICVGLHAMSPLSTGLFQRGIMQSITAISPDLIEDRESLILKSNQISKDVGCSSKNNTLENSPGAVIDCLRSKNAVDLVKAEDFYTSKIPEFFGPYFGSGCSGCVEFLPDSPINLLKSNQFTQVPTIMGATENEAFLFLAYLRPDIFLLNQKPNLTLALVEEIAPTILPQLSEKASREVFGYYLRKLNRFSSDDILEAVAHAFGDFGAYCPTLYTAERTNEAYLYMMTYRSMEEKTPEWQGVLHNDDLQYLFGKPFLNFQQYTLEDRRFSGNMIEKWSNFVKYGFPFNEGSDHIWPKFSSTVPSLTYELNIRKEGLIPFPRQEFCEFLRPYIYGDIS